MTSQQAMSETASQATAQSTASQVNIKLETNQIKANLKSLLRNVDQDKSGKIKTEVFFQMLALHKIELSSKDRAYLSKLFQNGDKIKYKEALAPL